MKTDKKSSNKTGALQGGKSSILLSSEPEQVPILAQEPQNYIVWTVQPPNKGHIIGPTISSLGER